MYLSKPTRRDFLASAGTGLVAIAQAVVPDSLAAQNKAVNGFNGLRAYGVNLYNETESRNYQRDEKGNFIPRLDQKMEFPFLFDGEMSGKRTRVLVHKDLPSGPYSLETKVYSKDRDASFPAEWAGFDKDFPSSVFFDHGFKGNVRGR